MAGKTVALADAAALSKVLFAMPQDEEGAKLLQNPHLDGFVAGAHLFDNIARVMRAIAEK